MKQSKTDFIKSLSYANVCKFFQRCELFVLNKFNDSHTYQIFNAIMTAMQLYYQMQSSDFDTEFLPKKWSKT